MSGMTCQIKNYKALRKQIEDLKKAPQKVLIETEKEIRKKAPGWIASGVADRYNLEGGRIGDAKKAVLSGKIGTTRIKGRLVDSTMRIEYSGRSLTPTHFGMTPINKPKPGSEYTLKWKVLRGGKGTKAKIKKLTKKQRKALSKNFSSKGSQNSPQSPFMLQPTGAKSEDKVQYIPFQRRGQTEPFRYVARGPALPQMVTNKDKQLRPEVVKHLNENLEKRFNHFCDRYIGK